MAGYGTAMPGCSIASVAIHRILAIEGEIVIDNHLINDSFASYYRSLYNTRVMNLEGD